MTAALTLCIPTKDRAEFLARLLHYYARTGYRHAIAIGDSSAPEQARRNQETVASLTGRLRITYHECPRLSSCACLEQLSALVTTSYCSFVADDDFVCPSGLEQCVAFLETHPAYVAAHGLGILLFVEGSHSHGPIGRVVRYRQAVLEAETASQRLRDYLTPGPYTVLYAVHRSGDWRAMFQGVSALGGEINQNVFKDELIPSSVSAIRGRIKELDSLYLIRHAHDAIYRQPHPYDWITSADWFPSYIMFRERLVNELMHQDGLRMQEAYAVIKEAFWPYFYRAIVIGWEKDQASPQRQPRWQARLRSVLKQLPGAQQGWRWLRIKAEGRRDAFSLDALLRPTSPHYADFFPVYQMIRSPSARWKTDGRARSREGDVVMAEAGAHG